MLENGDIVERHMMDGDTVLFNRQPSLNRMSMMCYIVKIMKKGDIFRINIGVIKAYYVEIYKITNITNNKIYIGQTRSHRLNRGKYYGTKTYNYPDNNNPNIITE